MRSIVDVEPKTIEALEMIDAVCVSVRRRVMR